VAARVGNDTFSERVSYPSAYNVENTDYFQQMVSSTISGLTKAIAGSNPFPRY
jgi:hypothetical protein